MYDPYEKTAAAMKSQSEGPKKFAKAAVGLGTAAASVAGAASFAPVLARAAPFLSQYIPEDLAIKGLSKISPNLGKFVKDSLGGGFDFNEVKDFIGEQINQSKEEPAKENRSILEQYSPELHAFIKEKIAKGVSPIQAATEAMNNKKFMNVIKKITQDHKAPWSSIVESVFGSGGKSSGMAGSTILDAVRGFSQEGQPQQQQPQQQMQQGQPQQSDPQIKQKLLQTMQALTQQLRS